MRKRKSSSSSPAEKVSASLLTILPIDDCRFCHFLECHANGILFGSWKECTFYDSNGRNASFTCASAFHSGTVSSEFVYVKKDYYCSLYSLDGVFKQRVEAPRMRIVSPLAWNGNQDTIYATAKKGQIGCWTADCQPLWSTRKGTNTFVDHFAVCHNLLFCIDYESFFEIWDQHRLLKTWKLDFTPCALAVVGNKVILSNYERENKTKILCFDFEGRPLCHWEIGMFVYRLAAGDQNLCWCWGSDAKQNTQKIFCLKLNKKQENCSLPSPSSPKELTSGGSGSWGRGEGEDEGVRFSARRTRKK